MLFRSRCPQGGHAAATALLPCPSLPLLEPPTSQGDPLRRQREGRPAEPPPRHYTTGCDKGLIGRWGTGAPLPPARYAPPTGDHGRRAMRPYPQRCDRKPVVPPQPRHRARGTRSLLIEPKHVVATDLRALRHADAYLVRTLDDGPAQAKDPSWHALARHGSPPLAQVSAWQLRTIAEAGRVTCDHME